MQLLMFKFLDNYLYLTFFKLFDLDGPLPAIFLCLNILSIFILDGMSGVITCAKLLSLFPTWGWRHAPHA